MTDKCRAVALFAVLLLLCFSQPLLAGPLFVSATEDSTAGWASVSEKVASLVVTDPVLIEVAQDEIREKGLKNNYRQFFSGRQFVLSKNGPPFLFVRPQSSPYRHTFYGAHSFMSWIVSHDGKVIFSSSSDRIEILRTWHGGRHDIAEYQCRSGFCYVTTYTYVGTEYLARKCNTKEIATGKMRLGCKP